MNQYGLIKENGVIKGYKMPEHDVHKKEYIAKMINQKATKADLRRAEAALDEWGFWLLGLSGYGDSSCNISEGDRMPASSRPPHGVEMSERVAKVIRITKFMLTIDSKHREYVRFIDCVYRHRRDNETFKNLFARLDFGFTYKQFFNARTRFAQLYTQRTGQAEYC